MISTTVSTRISNTVSNKELFDYWYSQVKFKNEALLAAPGHVETFRLRHDCTNYDQLWQSAEVQALPKLERDRAIAIIKYECTARVLQRRAGRLRDQLAAVEENNQALDVERSRFRRVIRLLQEKLFGKDQEIKQLQAKIAALITENEVTKADSEQSKAYVELLEKFEELQKAYSAIEKRKKELAKNNQSLGGRVAHTKRFRKERDEARAILLEQKEQIDQLTKLNQTLEAQNQEMRRQLSLLRPEQSL